MLALALSLLAPEAAASPADIFGPSARAIARGGGGVSLPGDAGSTMLNPAALSARAREGSEFMVAQSVARYALSELPPLYWDTNRDGLIDGADAPLTLDPRVEYEAADGLRIGVARDFAGKVVLGALIYAPQGRLLRLKTFDPGLPTYFMHQNRAHRYAVGLALSGEPLKGLHVGAGVRVISRSVLTVDFTLGAQVAGEPDEDSGPEDLVAATGEVHDLTFDLIPGVVPTGGLLLDLGAWVPALDGLALGASFRGEGAIPVTVEIDGQVNTRASDLGELEPFVAAALVQTQLLILDHYIPMQVRGGLSYTWRERVAAYADLEWTRWSRFGPSVTRFGDTRLDATLADLSEVTLTDLNSLDALVFSNTLGFKAGVEGRSPGFALPGRLREGAALFRGGFGYEPSPLVAQGPDTALLDADRLVFAGGLGLEHAPLWELIRGPHTWDLFFQYQLLARGQLERPTPESPRAGYAVDDAPIPIGGGLFTGGFQWSIAW